MIMVISLDDDEKTGLKVELKDKIYADVVLVPKLTAARIA